MQSVVTFHAGMAAIAYEWGSKNHPHPKDRSPDEKTHVDIAGLMQTYASIANSQEREYPVGSMNSLVYSVDGGMEVDDRRRVQYMIYLLSSIVICYVVMLYAVLQSAFSCFFS